MRNERRGGNKEERGGKGIKRREEGGRVGVRNERRGGNKEWRE